MIHDAAIAFILTNWPNAFPSAQASNDWDHALRRHTPEAVLAAVRRFHEDDDAGYKPTPGRIRKIIGQMVEERAKAPEDLAKRNAEDRAREIKAARSWLLGFDKLEAQGKLDQARSAIIDACQTIARMSDASDFAIARYAIGRLDELGLGPQLEVSKNWRAKLESAPAVMGEPIGPGSDLDFSEPTRWEDL